MDTATPARAFAVIVVNHVRPGRGADYLRLVAPVLDAMRHETSFINTVLTRDPDDPDRFMLFEIWADEEEFLSVQMKRPYRDVYERELPGMLRAPRSMSFWTPLREDYAFHHAGGFQRFAPVD